MGRGVDLAKALGGEEHARLIEDMTEQLLIVLVNRLGGKVSVPVAEIDGTGRFDLLMSLDPATRVFTFQARETPIEPEGRARTA